MKFFSVLAILSVAALVSAAPCKDETHNHENNSKHEDNSHSGNKQIIQNVGAVGSTQNKGLLSGLLGTGLLSETNNYNTVNQKAEIN
ncbi:hypothetical protein [Parasitella parasitica]|uniref:Uncharacterized protein n=1 Tax=Parasitella parasitica TaxID=35722 RepID=A0A0B7MWA2_9FUNG|nr:hypothetical protein [Parasitella parasitica]